MSNRCEHLSYALHGCVVSLFFMSYLAAQQTLASVERTLLSTELLAQSGEKLEVLHALMTRQCRTWTRFVPRLLNIASEDDCCSALRQFNQLLLAGAPSISLALIMDAVEDAARLLRQHEQAFSPEEVHVLTEDIARLAEVVTQQHVPLVMGPEQKTTRRKLDEEA